MVQPRIVVIAGPNGAGKTTVSQELVTNGFGLCHFANADWIAKGLTPLDVESAALRAGRVMLQRLKELRSRCESFAFETTLATRSFQGFLNDARASGYAVHLFYFWLATPELAVRRVSCRVEKGGHEIPRDVVLRRYERGASNLLSLYRHCADEWSVWDNSGQRPYPIVEGTNDGDATVFAPDAWARLRGLRHGDNESTVSSSTEPDAARAAAPIRRGIETEVEWLRAHNFPLWSIDEDANAFDARP